MAGKSVEPQSNVLKLQTNGIFRPCLSFWEFDTVATQQKNKAQDKSNINIKKTPEIP